jgi:uncharacterized membrane protein
MPNKRIFFIAAVFFISLLAGGKVSAEQISDFQTAIKINPDASIDVTEKIIYDFGDSEHHGIYRDIPVKYQRNNFNYNLKISNISVTDAAGQAERFAVSYPGNNIRIKIGDPDKMITGQHIYLIDYKIRRAINYFSDHDELYWNTTGNAWTVAIAKAEAQADFPEAADKTKISYACYSGAFGGHGQCSKFSASGTPTFYTANLQPGQGMTIVISLPKGAIFEPTALGNFIFILEDNWVLALPLVVLLILFLVWNRFGRDPKDKHPVVAQYDVPDNLTPVEAGTLIDTRVDNKDLSAEIIYLAIKGYLRITRLEEGRIFGIPTSHDYLLEKLKDTDEGINNIDLLLLNTLIPKKERRISQIKQDIDSKRQFDQVKDSVYRGLKEKGYIARNPNGIKIAFYVVGGAFLALAVFGLYNWLGLAVIISLILSGLLFFVFASLMGQRTDKGVEVENYLKGLKLYLGVVEKDRINFHNAPAKNPQTFEKFLPYAMALGVEKAWAGQFEGIYTQPPTWYSYPAGYNFTVIALTSDLRSFATSANMSMAAAASSGASGMGGGGFSGGGFGGGGGGSW